MPNLAANALKNLTSFLQDYHVSFANGLLILFTIGGEQIFTTVAFNCPCTHPSATWYALSFMVIPAVILLLVGIVISNLTWRIFHGCYHRAKEMKNSSWNVCSYFMVVIARSLIVPAAWLFVTLMDGKYYACLRAKFPCDSTTPEYVDLVRESQTISWYSLGGVVLIGFVVICCIRCCDSVTYLQDKFVSSYRDYEQKCFDVKIEERSKKLAEKYVGGFINQETLEKEAWDNISRAPDPKLVLEAKKSPISGTSDCSTFCTYLHKWAHENSISDPCLYKAPETGPAPVQNSAQAPAQNSAQPPAQNSA